MVQYVQELHPNITELTITNDLYKKCSETHCDSIILLTLANVSDRNSFQSDSEYFEITQNEFLQESSPGNCS